jgi:hypothetical protein
LLLFSFSESGWDERTSIWLSDSRFYSNNRNVHNLYVFHFKVKASLMV